MAASLFKLNFDAVKILFSALFSRSKRVYLMAPRACSFYARRLASSLALIAKSIQLSLSRLTARKYRAFILCFTGRMHNVFWYNA